MSIIPDSHVDLLEGPNFASLATIFPSGLPHVTPIWIDWDGNLIAFSTVAGRQKDVNMRRDPRAVIMVIDPKNPYRYLQVKARAVRFTYDGAHELVDKLAKQYRGEDRYSGVREGRIAVYLEPYGALARG